MYEQFFGDGHFFGLWRGQSEENFGSSLPDCQLDARNDKCLCVTNGRTNAKEGNVADWLVVIDSTLDSRGVLLQIWLCWRLGFWIRSISGSIREIPYLKSLHSSKSSFLREVPFFEGFRSSRGPILRVVPFNERFHSSKGSIPREF